MHRMRMWLGGCTCRVRLVVMALPASPCQMLVPFQDAPVEVEENTELPDYLPEDESPTKEQDKAVSRVGSHPEGGASWLSTAANFLSRSFYW